MLKKGIILTIALMVVEVTIASAQQPVPLPLLPQMNLTMPPRDGGYKVNVTSAQLRQMLENRDQRKYAEYLFNSGYITEDEFRSRSENLDKTYYGMIGSIQELDMFAVIFANDVVENELKKIWPSWSPGWPGREIRQITGLSLQQPQGTRSSFSFDLRMIRGSFTPYSDQAYNDFKQQLETALGAPLELNQDFAHDPDNNYEYQYVLRSNKSVSGKPYLIVLTRYTSNNRIYLEVAELRKDP
jgi:hypothetical protein